MNEIQDIVNPIIIRICKDCLNGKSKECHTPGCALCYHFVDLPIHKELYTSMPFPEHVRPLLVSYEGMLRILTFNNLGPMCYGGGFLLTNFSAELPFVDLLTAPGWIAKKVKVEHLRDNKGIVEYWFVYFDPEEIFNLNVEYKYADNR